MRALIFLIAAIIIFLLLRWLRQQPRKVWLQFAAVGLGIGLILLAMTGRLHWLAALFGVLLPFARRLIGLLGYLPVIQRLVGQFQTAKAAQGPSGGGRSQVESRYLRMALDHQTGEMSGEVLLGRFKGRQLGDMSIEELLELYAQCQAQDQESTALLQTYLDTSHGEDWRERAQASNAHATTPSGRISRTEAYDILGLPPEASREQIIETHRRLIQKLHPDRGGSTYLAAKINQAKDLLLDSVNG
ncbi:MAG: DnaJ domain-containing protein [Pseudomonadota bacterium]